MEKSPDGSRSETPPVKTVLVIDDEEVNVKLVTRMLMGEGFRVIGSLSAEEGLEILRQ
jgi:CheY-like chemotaxis protein